MASDSIAGHSGKPPAQSSEAQPDHKQEELSALQQFSRWIKGVVGAKSENSLKEALEEVLEEHDEGEDSPISLEERTLLRNMISFGDVKVGDVMIPRPDIIAVPKDISLEDMKQFISEHRHTRIPIYEASLDSVVGFIHLKDFFRCLIGECEFDINELKRDVLFVPPSMKIVDLMLRMRVASCHMAIVVDEYGGTDGLVTMEDMFEEIVGEIQDEHDDDEVLPEMHWINDRTLEADARIRIEDLEETTKRDVMNGHDPEDIDTVGGLVFATLGRIPAKGEVLDLGHGMRCEILAADPRRVKRVRLAFNEAVASDDED